MKSGWPIGKGGYGHRRHVSRTLSEGGNDHRSGGKLQDWRRKKGVLKEAGWGSQEDSFWSFGKTGDLRWSRVFKLSPMGSARKEVNSSTPTEEEGHIRSQAEKRLYHQRRPECETTTKIPVGEEKGHIQISARKGHPEKRNRKVRANLYRRRVLGISPIKRG